MQKLEARTLPEQIDYYSIGDDGSVASCNAVKANVYISEFDVQYLSDKETMLHIKSTYGDVVGVMHDVNCKVQPREFRTPKMLLGVVRAIN